MATFEIEVLTPEREFYQGDIEALIVSTQDGEMGILKGHVPMIIALQPGNLRIKDGNSQWREATSGEGFLSVRADGVSVLVQSAEWPEETEERLAAEAARRAAERNERVLKEQNASQGLSERSRAINKLKSKK